MRDNMPISSERSSSTALLPPPLMLGLSYSSMLILLPPAPAPAPPEPIEAWLDDLWRSTPGVAREVSQPSPLANSNSELANLRWERETEKLYNRYHYKR